MYLLYVQYLNCYKNFFLIVNREEAPWEISTLGTARVALYGHYLIQQSSCVRVWGRTRSEIVSSDLNNSLISMIIHSSLIKYYKKYIVFEIFHICNIEYRIHIIAPLIFIAWNFSLFPFLFTISPHLHRLLTKKSESALVFGCSLTLIHLHLIVSFC